MLVKTQSHNSQPYKVSKWLSNPPADSPLDLSRRLLISSSDQREPRSSSLTPSTPLGDHHRLDVNAAVISPASTVASFSTDSGIRDEIQCYLLSTLFVFPYPLQRFLNKSQRNGCVNRAFGESSRNQAFTFYSLYISLVTYRYIVHNIIESTPSSSSEDSHHGNVLRPLPPSSSSTPSALLTLDLPNKPLHFERSSPAAESVTSTVSSVASPTIATSDKNNNNSRTTSTNSNSSPPKKTAKKASNSLV